MENNTNTNTVHLVKVRPELDARRFRKGRVHTDWQTSEVEPKPTEPCTDLNCGSPTCDWARRNGSTPEVDHKAWKAFNRRVLKAWRSRLIDILAEEFDVPAETIKVRFSVNAGCSMCPCSPGWVIDQGLPWLHNNNVFIETLRAD